MTKAKVGVWGGAGYTGGELLRLLSGHPGVELARVASRSHAGSAVTKPHPHLRRLDGLKFAAELDPAGLDAVLLAGGHGEAMHWLPGALAKGASLKVVDLSADFRLKDPALYSVWYGRAHAAPELLDGFVYGLPEFDSAAIRKATRVANPGCFATAVALALGPLAASGLGGTARVTAVTGSSGSGASPSATTHHPAREGSLKAYKPLAHQHVPEIEAFLARLAGRSPAVPALAGATGVAGPAGKPSFELAMVPVSGPFVRGIYAICHVTVPESVDLEGLYAQAYAGRPFVRLVDSPPDLKAVSGSNHCDLHIARAGGETVVIAALDNLVKGAAGQAVQNLNLMLGLEETLGLEAAGAYP
ncbi:MAG: N-acetyl-gamma-glutamyl-phosphate reductase [Elusimicrobia bacterium]|nr:N-acetyl-gamma-glutamyl-phosphate reductase [Elusimicrobiota bacterium]